jgi:hypothetical protein
MTKKSSISTFAALLGLALGLAACGHPDSSGVPIPEFVENLSGPEDMGTEWDRAENADVYIIGSSDRVFKNGVTKRLEGMPCFQATSSVFVSDGDVYIAGQAHEHLPGLPEIFQFAVLWKNGVPQRLGRALFTDPSGRPVGESSAYSVCVAGGHVYVAGSEDAINPDYSGQFSNVMRMPTLWVDGVPQHLPTGSIYGGEAFSVFVSPGGDVYVGGRASGGCATIWKNGVRQELRPCAFGRSASVRSVFVDGDDVYATGYDWVGVARAVLWKNGVGQLLLDGASLACSVFVSDGDVYVAGREDDLSAFPIDRGYAVLWKNGVKQRLTEGIEGNGIANSVFVSSGDVYLAGWEHVTSGPWKRIARLWVNGEAMELNPSGLSYPNSVFVVDKGK